MTKIAQGLVGVTDTIYPFACTVRMFVRWVHGDGNKCGIARIHMKSG